MAFLLGALLLPSPLTIGLGAAAGMAIGKVGAEVGDVIQDGLDKVSDAGYWFEERWMLFKLRRKHTNGANTDDKQASS